MTTQDLTSTVVSRDGTTIAVDRYGSGPALVLAGGAFTGRRRSPRSPGRWRRISPCSPTTGAAAATAATHRPTQ